MITPGPITIDALRLVAIINDAYKVLQEAAFINPLAERRAMVVGERMKRFLTEIDTGEALNVAANGCFQSERRRKMSSEKIKAVRCWAAVPNMQSEINTNWIFPAKPNDVGLFVEVIIRTAEDEARRRRAEKVLVGWVKCTMPADATSEELDEVVAAIQVLAEDPEWMR